MQESRVKDIENNINTKVNEGKPNQLAWSFNIAKKFTEKYLAKDITKDETWNEIVRESNEIVKLSKIDYLTIELLVAVINYLEELYKLEVNKNLPPEVKEEVTQIQGFQVQGFQVQGFQIKECEE